MKNVNLINLTPHDIVLVKEGQEDIIIKASGIVPRCREIKEATGNLIGFPVVGKSFGAVENMPTPEENTVFIVSALVAQALQDRDDVVIPDDVVRDEAGRIIGCRGFAKVPASSHKDPIRRVLAELILSQTALQYDSAPVTFRWAVEPRIFENSCADHSIGQEAIVLGKFETSNELLGKNSRRTTITGGKVVLVYSVVGRETTIRRPRRLMKVVIRPGIDAEQIIEFLEDPHALGREV